jgi:hypothetical protein
LARLIDHMYESGQVDELVGLALDPLTQSTLTSAAVEDTRRMALRWTYLQGAAPSA